MVSHYKVAWVFRNLNCSAFNCDFSSFHSLNISYEFVLKYNGYMVFMNNLICSSRNSKKSRIDIARDARIFPGKVRPSIFLQKHWEIRENSRNSYRHSEPIFSGIYSLIHMTLRTANFNYRGNTKNSIDFGHFKWKLILDDFVVQNKLLHKSKWIFIDSNYSYIYDYLSRHENHIQVNHWLRV